MIFDCFSHRKPISGDPATTIPSERHRGSTVVSCQTPGTVSGASGVRYQPTGRNRGFGEDSQPPTHLNDSRKSSKFKNLNFPQLDIGYHTYSSVLPNFRDQPSRISMGSPERPVSSSPSKILLGNPDPGTLTTGTPWFVFNPPEPFGT